MTSPSSLMNRVDDTIYFEGEITEEVIAGLLKKAATLSISAAVRSRLKIVLIELCTNIVTHHSGTAHGEVSVKSVGSVCEVQISSFVSRHDYSIVENLLNEVKQQPDYEAYYYNKLANNQDDNKSARMGLARIYKMCRGKVDLESTLVVSKTRLTIKLKLDDTN